MTKKRAIIVGAGPGGLAASMILAHNGYQVDIFEKNGFVGGRNAPIKLGGYTFDTGPTFLMMLDVLERIFAACGKNLHDYAAVQELDPMYRLVFSGNRTLMLSRDKAKMKQTLEAFSPGSYAGYERYLAKEKHKYDKLIPCLQMPYGRLADLLAPQFLSSIPHLDAHTSFYNVLGRYFTDNDVKIAFTFQAKYIGMSPWTAPGTFSIISYIEHGGGIYHVTGGLNQLSVQMAKAAQESGANIHLSAPVKRIIVENNIAVGIELEDGLQQRADYVVINADFGHAMTHLVDIANRRKWTDANLRKKLYSCSTYMLYLGVNKTYPDLPHHNIIFADDYRKNVSEIVDTFTLSDNFSFYVQNASVTDPSLAPAGKSALYVLVPVPNNKSIIDWQAQSASYRDKVITALETRGGFTGIRDAIEEEKIITPQGWERDHDVYLGATFNLGHNVSQMLYFRPHNEFEEFKNCYLVGGGTHPGSGLPTIYESGRISAELILKRDGIR